MASRGTFPEAKQDTLVLRSSELRRHADPGSTVVFLCDANVEADVARDACLLAGLDALLTSSARAALALAAHGGARAAVLGAAAEGWHETLPSFRDLSIPVIVVGGTSSDPFLTRYPGIDLGLLSPVDAQALARAIRLLGILTRAGPSETVEFGPFRLDPWTGEVKVLGEMLTLAPKQFALLHRLLDQPGRLVRSRELVVSVWPEVPGMTINDLHWHVSKLRRTLRAAGLPADTIVNRRGLGYLLTLASPGQC